MIVICMGSFFLFFRTPERRKESRNKFIVEFLTDLAGNSRSIVIQLVRVARRSLTIRYFRNRNELSWLIPIIRRDIRDCTLVLSIAK